MEYIVSTTALYSAIEKEISRAAATMYSDDGVSLFDALKVTSRDEDTIEEYIEDSKDAILATMSDIAIGLGGVISFDVPDFDVSSKEEVAHLLDRFIIFNTCNQWFKEKGSDRAEMYLQRAEAAITRANILLKTRDV